MEKVKLYDTTLRDGMQGPGMTLSVDEKLRVVGALDALGIDFIEAGFPSSNPKEVAFFTELAEHPPSSASPVAFGMTRRKGVQPYDDEALEVLAGSFTEWVCIVGKTWRLHLEKVTKVSAEENLAMIADSVEWLVGQGKKVHYDAEHFFDAWRDDPAYTTDCLRAAVGAGASIVSLCDTNGSSLPDQVASATSAMASEFSGGVELGIHTHNDMECGVANALAAVREGARVVQGTINGYGERCGNANLVSIIPALELKMGFEAIGTDRLESLSSVSREIADLVNLPVDPSQPYVGSNAFAHKGGMHVAGVSTDARTFEHLDPSEVGNTRAILPSELSGKATIRTRAEEIGLDLDEGAIENAIKALKEREHEGYHYEAARGSFDLLLRRCAGEYRPLFRLEGFRVTTEMDDDGSVSTEATLRLWVNGERHLTVAEGNGPVNALDQALRSALVEHYPDLANVELTGYRVRILDSDHGTGAGTRVLLDSTDGQGSWSTIGVSRNIIEASWQALVDSLEVAFQGGASDVHG